MTPQLPATHMAWETPPSTRTHVHARGLAPDGLAGAWLAQPGVRQALPRGSSRQVPALVSPSLGLSPAWLMPGSSQSCVVRGPRPILPSQVGPTPGQSCSVPVGSLARPSVGLACGWEGTGGLLFPAKAANRVLGEASRAPAKSEA